MKYILFGGGHAGAEAMLTLGIEHIHCFCDNACDSDDMYVQGVPVIGFDEFLKIFNEYIVVISANENNSDEIALQLESYGVEDYIFFYDEVKNVTIAEGKEESLILLSSELNRARFKAKHFLYESERRKKQLGYITEQLDPHQIKKASGYIRKEQKKSLVLAAELLGILKELDIKVFALGGTLIGAVRHGGFVPWDDDIDFGIMRNDFVKLIEYAKEKWFVFEREEAGVGNYRTLNSNIVQYKGEYILEISAYCASIIRGTSIADYAIVDFFPFDYFEDDYEYADYKNLILKTKGLVEATNNENERLKIENRAVCENDHIRDDSDHISFSLDSMMAYDHLHNTSWINKQIIFPVINIEFEDRMIPAPNDYEKFLKVDIPGYKSMPMDAGISHRIIRRNLCIRKILQTVELYITNVSDIELFHYTYETLNANGVYALYIVERHSVNHQKEQSYDDIVNRIIDKQIEYSEHHSYESTLGVCSTASLECITYKNVCKIDPQTGNEEIYRKIVSILGDLSVQ